MRFLNLGLSLSFAQQRDSRYGDTRYKIQNASRRKGFCISCIFVSCNLYLTEKPQFERHPMWSALLCYVVIANTYLTASAISSSTLARTASIISADLAQRENLISLPKTASISAITRSLP